MNLYKSNGNYWYLEFENTIRQVDSRIYNNYDELIEYKRMFPKVKKFDRQTIIETIYLNDY